MAQTRFATVPAHPRPSRYEVVVRHDVLAGVALYQRHERRIALLHTEIEPRHEAADLGGRLARVRLWPFADVKANADRILGAVRSGSMLCDMEWPDEQVELLQRWIGAGTQQ
jgi:hypothetical protein